MQGIATISGKIDGTYSCKFQFDKKLLEIYIPISVTDENRFMRSSDLNICIESMRLCNLQGTEFIAKNRIDCIAISIQMAGISVTDNHLDNIMDLNTKNSYHVLKIVPLNKTVKLETSVISNANCSNYSNGGLFNRLEYLQLEIKASSGSYYVTRKENGLTFLANKQINKRERTEIYLYLQ
jgi:hypothetical protein